MKKIILKIFRARFVAVVFYFAWSIIPVIPTQLTRFTFNLSDRFTDRNPQKKSSTFEAFRILIWRPSPPRHISFNQTKPMFSNLWKISVLAQQSSFWFWFLDTDGTASWIFFNQVIIEKLPFFSKFLRWVLIKDLIFSTVVINTMTFSCRLWIFFGLIWGFSTYIFVLVVYLDKNVV